MAQLTADFFSLCDVRVARYAYDASLGTAEVTFRLTSYKSRKNKDYKVFQQAPPTQAPEVTTTSAWRHAWAMNSPDMIAFAETETAAPAPWTAFQVPTVFPPYWVTDTELGDWAPRTNVVLPLVCSMATSYKLAQGALPTGMTLDAATGTLAGIAVLGSYNFSVTGTNDASGLSDTQNFHLRVVNAPTFVAPVPEQ